jgi:hypothetical protein
VIKRVAEAIVERKTWILDFAYEPISTMVGMTGFWKKWHSSGLMTRYLCIGTVNLAIRSDYNQRHQ